MLRRTEAAMAFQTTLNVVQTGARELWALSRSVAWPVALLSPLPPIGTTSVARRPAVLVHGYLAHAQMMRPLQRTLRDNGWEHTHLVSYPSLGADIEHIVQRIQDAVVPLAAQHGPVDLIAHSLGAVSARIWMKMGPGAAHVARFVSLGGPHAGTGLHRLMPGHLHTVLDPEGPWVRAIAHGPEPVPTIIIRARYDHQVLPPKRAHVSGVPEVVLPNVGHNSLLWSREAHDQTVAFLSR